MLSQPGLLMMKEELETCSKDDQRPDFKQHWHYQQHLLEAEKEEGAPAPMCLKQNLHIRADFYSILRGEDIN